MLNSLIMAINRTLCQGMGAAPAATPQAPTLVDEIRVLTEKGKNAVPLGTPLKETRFVVIDTETTGFHPYQGDEVISLGAVVVQGGRIREEATFHRLVNPGRDIPPVVTDLTGITNSMVAQAPDFSTVLRDFLFFAHNSVLVGHALDFDLAFCNLKLKKLCHQRIRHLTLDTYRMSFLVDPFARNRSLDGLLASHGIPATGRHTALGDAMLTARLLLVFLDILAGRHITTLHHLRLALHHQYLQLSGRTQSV